MTATLKIGFQGNPGAHSEQAIKSSLRSGIPLAAGGGASQQTPQHQIVPMPSTDLDNLFAAITNIPQPLVDLCYVPLENTLSGTFSNVYEMLLKYHARVHVIGEWVVHEDNDLMVLNDSPVKSPAEITELYSHSAVLEQCSCVVNELRAANRDLVVHAMDDTAGAAKFIGSRKLTSAAVIAHPSNCKLYGLRSLKKSVEDDQHSATRYLVISPKPWTNEQLGSLGQEHVTKTSLAVCLKNAPGTLLRAISCFALRDLNITKMESRPSMRAKSSFINSQSPWEYINYIDIEGGIESERVRNALANLQEYGKVWAFGSYPRYNGQQQPTQPTILGGPFGM